MRVYPIPPPPSSFNPSFRPPFQSPASRPGSSIWSPSPSASVLVLPKSKPLAPSTRLPTKLNPTDKPWLAQNDSRTRISWWFTLSGLLLGIAGTAILCWSAAATVLKIDNSNLCLVLEDQFDSLDTHNTWTRDVQLGGFGSGQFQIATNDPVNSYAKNSNLYILPTLTSATLGTNTVLTHGTYTVPGCTSPNKTACTAKSDGKSTVINPVMSARLSTKGKASIRYGRVEVRAKLPRGDWLWPAIWMLPENNTYGPGPLSGEIDLMESRGNTPTSSSAGTTAIRSALHYGPLPTLTRTLAGWRTTKRPAARADRAFHTYALEWDTRFMRAYVDSRVHAVLDLRFVGSRFFWQHGAFPPTALGPTGAEVVVKDVWADAGGGAIAPFDQEFYLGLGLAVGGTNGWFPDGVGGKPWNDGSLTAMRDFALAQNEWAATWATSEDDLAFRVDYVKMWKLC